MVGARGVVRDAGAMRTTTPLAPTIGLLWATSGAFVLLEPFGPSVAWSDAKQFEVVIDHARYVLYGAPGPLRSCSARWCCCAPAGSRRGWRWSSAA
jgi:hypothetical protein